MQLALEVLSIYVIWDRAPGTVGRHPRCYPDRMMVSREDISVKITAQWVTPISRFHIGTVRGLVVPPTENLQRGNRSTALAHPDGAGGLLRHFCELRGFTIELSALDCAMVLKELHKASRELATARIEHNKDLDVYDLAEPKGHAKLYKPRSLLLICSTTVSCRLGQVREQRRVRLDRETQRDGSARCV